jgi:hypothetical protein
MCVVSLPRAAKLLGVSPRSLADRRYRARLGLAGRRIGGRLVFIREEVIALLEAGRERF